MQTYYKVYYTPTPEQQALHDVPLSPSIKTEVFFGGKKGVGKSAAGLGEGFMFALKYPKAKICIVGETLDNVKDSFLVKLPSLFPQTTKDANGRTIRLYAYFEKAHDVFPSRCVVFPNGSFITFAYCANLEDAKKFQGKEYNLIIIDEVTRHEKIEIDIIESSLRSSIQYDSDGKAYWIPTKLVTLGNPGGKGNDWVFKKYIDPCVSKWAPLPGRKIPLETKDFVFMQQVRGHEPIKVIRRFIQGNSNPFINAAYYASLESLDEMYRKQYLDGDWNIVAGRMFDVKVEQRLSSAVSNALLEKYKNEIEIYISIDWGYNPSAHSAHWHAVFSNKVCLTFKELYGRDLDFEDFAKTILDMSGKLDISAILLPHDMFRRGDKYRDDSGNVIGEMKSDIFENLGFNTIGVMSGTPGIVAERNSKIKASTNMRTPDSKPKFYISKDDCPSLLEELDEAIYDEIKEGHVARNKADHAIDDYGLFLTFYSDDIAPEEGLMTEEERATSDRIDELIRKHDQKKKEEAEAVVGYVTDDNAIPW